MPHSRTRRTASDRTHAAGVAILGLLLSWLSFGCGGTDPAQTGATLSITDLLAEVRDGKLADDAPVVVSGIVTDYDPERHLAHLADDRTGVALHTRTAVAGLRRGDHVTLQARVELAAAPFHLIDATLLASRPGQLGTLAPSASALADVSLLGRRIEIAARVQAAARREGRLHLTLTTGGMQLDAEVRDAEDMDDRALLGADVRLVGVAAQPGPAQIGSAPRVLVASPADIDVAARAPKLASAQTLLTSADAIRRLSPTQAAAGHPVQLRARVTVHDPAWAVLFVQDDSAGIFVMTRSLEHEMPALRPGDIVEIAGRAGPGEFAPVIAAGRLTVRAPGPLPPARQVSLPELLGGGQDSQLVEISGIIRSAQRDTTDHLTIELVHARERIRAFVPSIGSQAVPAGLGPGALVTVRAVAGARFNANQQIIGVQLWVPTAREVIVEEGAADDPFDLPASRITDLLRFSSLDHPGRPVRVRGTVAVVARDNAVYLRAPEGGLEVHAAERAGLRPGDEVEAVGFAVAGAYSPLLEDALLRRIGPGELPAPVPMRAVEVLEGHADGTLVRLQGRLLQHVTAAAEDVLVVDSEGTTFSAHLDRQAAGGGRLMALQTGSTIELTGVAALQAMRQSHRLVPREFTLLLPSAGSVRVLEAPPWLTGRRLGWALATLGGMITLALGWIFSLRQRVARQTDQLRLAKDAAEAANEAKSQFLANISHEIRTPMNGVLGLTNLLLDAPHSADQRQYLDMVKSSAEALLHVINDTLDFSKIEAGKLQLASQRFRLRPMLNEAVDLLALTARQKGLALTCHVADDVPAEIVGDAGRLRQVILNLVGNALKFTERGGVRVEAYLQRTPAPEAGTCTLRFTVVDTGIGIPAEQQSAIFEPFAQADGSVSRRYGGTGLGLPISTALVALMGGQVRLASEPGIGSTFAFSVCVGVPDPNPAGENEEAAGTAADVPTARCDSIRVLIAEDNVVNQRVAAALVARSGQQAVIVENGREAVEAWEGGGFDVILMDVQMPEMDGFEATARIRAAEKRTGRRIPIIAMTAHAMSGDRERCLDAGMDGYITKPISAADIDRVLLGVGREGPEAGRRESMPARLPAPGPALDLTFTATAPTR